MKHFGVLGAAKVTTTLLWVVPRHDPVVCNEIIQSNNGKSKTRAKCDSLVYRIASKELDSEASPT
jgi:hypothetical protein